MMTYGDGQHEMTHDGTFVYGSSESNGVRAHQLKSGLHGGCYLSFSRSEAVAIGFATGNGRYAGFVYVADDSLFSAHGVVAAEFRESAKYPDQAEVSVRAVDNGELPLAVVVRKNPQGR
jgi:hypothetical protein